MPVANYVTETQIVKRVVSNPGKTFIWTKHALDKMGQLDVTAADVEAVLMNGHVVLEERKQDILWRVRGRDVDLRQFEIVIAVYEDVIEIKVVTVF